MSAITAVVDSVLEAITKSAERTPKPYDAVGRVTKIDGKTAWVHIDGSTIEETPVKKTIACKPGDEVQIRVGGGKAWITGNSDSPPTDDTTASQALKGVQIMTKSMERIYKGVTGLNTLIRESVKGVEVGKVDRHGHYVNGHTLIDAEHNDFRVINAEGDVVAKFGEVAQIGEDDQYVRLGSSSIVMAVKDYYQSLKEVFRLTQSSGGILRFRKPKKDGEVLRWFDTMEMDEDRIGFYRGKSATGNVQDEYAQILLDRHDGFLMVEPGQDDDPYLGQDVTTIQHAKLDLNGYDAGEDLYHEVIADGRNGKVDADSGFFVAGDPIIQPVRGEISVASVPAGGFEYVVPLTAPTGWTLIGVGEWGVYQDTSGGSGVTLCQVRQVWHENNNAVHILGRNNGTTAGQKWKFFATGLYIKC